MYAISAETNGVNTIEVPLLDNFQLDLPAITNNLADSKIVFICSPNNPTADLINIDDILSVLKQCHNNQVVVVDEAYIEFCPSASVIGLLNDYPNLVILRTLSKAFGLAGIRCGFTLASPHIIEALKKVIAPYPIPGPVAHIAEQALSSDGIKWMQDIVAELNQRRNVFIEYANSWVSVKEALPSQTNFVLVKLAERVNIQDVMALFKEQKVLLRDQSKQLLLDNCLRITIGSEAEIDQVISIFSTMEQSL
jgi:histidinol-phosphate aminotransferase